MNVLGLGVRGEGQGLGVRVKSPMFRREGEVRLGLGLDVYIII